MEKPLQMLIEANLDALLGIRFLASEYWTGETRPHRLLELDVNNVYMGTSIGETPTHWIQHLSPNTAILHDKAHCPALSIGQAGTLRYSAGHVEWVPERHPGQNRTMGR